MCQNWKTGYTEHLLSGKIKQAGEIKNKHISRSFYKYRCFDANEHWIDWVKGILYINSPKHFNDPFDCLLTIAPETNKKMLIEALGEFLSQYVKLNNLDIRRLEFSDEPIEASLVILEQHGIKVNRELIKDSFLKEYKEKRQDQFFRDIFKVTCFSEKNDSILMWSHYTNHHQGFCIEYNFENDREISGLLYPVIYSERRAILLPHHIKHSNWPIFTILCKAPEWAYEQEWRYVNAIDPTTQQDRSKSIILTAPDTVKAIYIGAEAIKYNAKSVKKLTDIAKEFNTKLYEMKFDDYEYKLIPHTID